VSPRKASAEPEALEARSVERRAAILRALAVAHPRVPPGEWRIEEGEATTTGVGYAVELLPRSVILTPLGPDGDLIRRAAFAVEIPAAPAPSPVVRRVDAADVAKAHADVGTFVGQWEDILKDLRDGEPVTETWPVGDVAKPIEALKLDTSDVNRRAGQLPALLGARTHAMAAIASADTVRQQGRSVLAEMRMALAALPTQRPNPRIAGVPSQLPPARRESSPHKAVSELEEALDHFDRWFETMMPEVQKDQRKTERAVSAWAEALTRWEQGRDTVVLAIYEAWVRAVRNQTAVLRDVAEACSQIGVPAPKLIWPNDLLQPPTVET
jgi:hypothetical protein